MSELKVDTWKSSDGTREFGICTAWVNFNGTLAGPIDPRDSLNVSSISDNGTGDYTINFSTPLDDINFSTVGSAGEGVASNQIVSTNQQANTTSTARVRVANDAGNVEDVAFVNIIIFGGIT